MLGDQPRTLPSSVFFDRSISFSDCSETGTVSPIVVVYRQAVIYLPPPTANLPSAFNGCRSKAAACLAVEDVTAYMMAVPKHRAKLVQQSSSSHFSSLTYTLFDGSSRTTLSLLHRQSARSHGNTTPLSLYSDLTTGKLRYDQYLCGVRNWIGYWVRSWVRRSCGYLIATSSSCNEATLPSIAVGD